MAHYGPICVWKAVWVLFGLGETSLEWGLGARLSSLRPLQWPITGPYVYRSVFGFCVG